MTAPLFLRRVELSNFRTYGENFALDMVPGPGIVLLTGSNGLGKTTFFDGIEWCLTDRISRFDGLPRPDLDPLTRFGQKEGSHRVSLYFSDGDPIDRVGADGPAAADIAAFLKSQAWPSIGDLGHYLSMTHFLGQSSVQRFSIRDSSAQWRLLEGPAGIDEINLIRERLGGQAATQAMNRAVAAAQTAANDAEGRAREWRELTALRERFSRLAFSDNALDGDAALDNLGALLAEAGLPSLPTGGANPEAALAAAAGMFADAIAAATRRRDQVLEIAPRIPTYVETGRLVAAARSDLETERTALSERQSALAAAEERIESLTSERDTKAAMHQQLTDQHAALTAAIVAARFLKESAPRVAALGAEVDDARSAAERQALEVNRLAAIVTDARARGARAASLRRDIARVDALTETVRVYLALVEEQRLDSDDIEAELAVARSRRAELAGDDQKLASEIEANAAALRALEDRASVIARAVQAISSHLTAHDAECPLCHTAFATGELLASIRAAEDNAGQHAAELQRQAETLAARRAAVTLELTSLDGTIATIRAKITGRAVRSQALADQLEGLQLAGLAPDTASEILAARRDDRLRDLDQCIAEIAAMGDEEAAVAAHRDAEIELSRLREVEAAASGAIAALLAERQEATGIVGRVAEGSGDLGLEALLARLALLSREVQAAAAALEAAATNRARARQELDEKRAAVVSATALITRLEQLIAEGAERQATLLGEWTDLGLDGTPSVSLVQNILANGERNLARLQKIEDRRRELLGRYEQWLRNKDLAELEARIATFRETLKPGRDESTEAALDRLLNRTQLELERATVARRRVQALRKNLRSKANSFAAGVLKPLNDSIGRFAHALLTRADGSVAYTAEHHLNRARLISSIQTRAGDGETKELPLSPNYFFSEGELSAMSVSTLFAASTAFPWSRWRCVLMDDPLQHNDIIHGSAFIDLLRNMVRHLDYQVILSTHDSSEAQFLLRKCQAAGLNVTYCELAPSGEQGLVSSAA
ncbi:MULTISPECIES: ATP-binding protein [Sphingobium]|jgi:DNA repair exonuclease SbcCD ATPase subunit|uniref:ATP-binding protein n=1 Tax=Sphingobium TaxID=165695 RepID=UPI00148517B7|nr:ATP-binding protein [Sphingobium sp. RSMS]UXC93007.1 AAA family ATPase [Sphingobium sp. RSMS]